MSGQTNIAKQHRAGAVEAKAPIDVVMEPPGLLSRYTCATIMAAIFGIWGKIAFYDHSGDGTYDESKAPDANDRLSCCVAGITHIFEEIHIRECGR